MSDIRNLLTNEEIEEIKTRLVYALVNEVFTQEVSESEKGENYTYRRLRAHISQEIKDTVRDLMRDEVERVAREVVAPRVAEMSAKMTDRFVEQTGKIIDKINWYWSIK